MGYIVSCGGSCLSIPHYAAEMLSGLCDIDHQSHRPHQKGSRHSITKDRQDCYEGQGASIPCESIPLLVIGITLSCNMFAVDMFSALYTIFRVSIVLVLVLGQTICHLSAPQREPPPILDPLARDVLYHPVPVTL
jgi:hypothetical protein